VKLEIVQKPSPNYRAVRRANITHIVLHIMDGTLAGTDAWFASPVSQVSAHYGIGREGQVHQYVAEECEAWHCGRILNPSVTLRRDANGVVLNPNSYTIGIELEGRADSDVTIHQYYVLALMLKDLSRRHGIPLVRENVWLHREVYAAKSCPGRLDRDLALSLAAHSL